MKMHRLDMKLLNLLQNSFPIEPHPYLALGKQLNITEEEVIDRICILKKNGYIRRIGGIFDSKKLGYFSTLCALKVPQGRIEEVAGIINKYDGVTHNYIRKHSLNMWFTLIAPSVEKIEDILEEIKFKTKINEILNMPAVKVFKVKTNFVVMEE